MIVICASCNTRLQLDDAKLPSRPFTVRCPKCQQTINAQPPGGAGDGSALSVGGDLPPSGRPSREQRMAVPAPAFRLDVPADPSNKETVMPAIKEGDVARLLVTLLQRSMSEDDPGKGRRSWELRKALICSTPAHRDAVARVLVRNQYEVFVAEDTSQAIERMREDRMDVVLLDLEFDAIEQGAAFITREISALRPPARRRLFFVHLSPSARTADGHTAFLNHVNLVVNVNDVETLPRVLERSIRDFNELYRDYNRALGVSEL